jgi:hypothetical protein
MSAEYGSHVSGAGDNNTPVEESGGAQKGTGRLTKAGDFGQGEAGERPEDILRKRKEQNPGNDEFGSQSTGAAGPSSRYTRRTRGYWRTHQSLGLGKTEEGYHAAGGRIP